MAEITQETWERRLHMRASRLVRLTELKAPDMILTNEKILVAKAVLELEPERLAHALAHMAEGMKRESDERESLGAEDKPNDAEAKVIEEMLRQRREKLT